MSTTTEQSYAVSPQLGETLRKYQHIWSFIGLVFLILMIAGYFLAGPEQFFRSYLVGILFWLGASGGCLLLLMTQYLTGGAWGVMIRRPLEAGAKTIYVMFLLTLPLLLGMHKLYWWTTEKGLADPRIQGKHLYLNIEFLWIRWVIYGIVWLGLTYFLLKWSRQEDETRSMEYSAKLEWLSGPGTVAYFFTMTFFAVDFVMTLEPHWYSTVYGFMVTMGQCLTGMCIVVAALVLTARFAPMDHAVTRKHLHDLGKLMLAIVMLWAYMNFAQLLITWSGNLPDEVIWYVKRWNGPAGWIAVAILLFHFCLPFCLLLSQQLKRNMNTISMIAIFIIVIRLVDVYSLVEPNFVDINHPTLQFSWLDLVAPLGFGGLWLAMFFRNLPGQPLLPLGDPNLQKAVNHGRSH